MFAALDFGFSSFPRLLANLFGSFLSLRFLSFAFRFSFCLSPIMLLFLFLISLHFSGGCPSPRVVQWGGSIFLVCCFFTGLLSFFYIPMNQLMHWFQISRFLTPYNLCFFGSGLFLFLFHPLRFIFWFWVCSCPVLACLMILA